MTTVSFVCVRSEVEINQKRKVARPFLFEKLFWHLGCTRILCVRKVAVVVYIKYWVSTSSRKSISSFTLILSHTHTFLSLSRY